MRLRLGEVHRVVAVLGLLEHHRGVEVDARVVDHPWLDPLHHLVRVRVRARVRVRVRDRVRARVRVRLG